MKYSYYCEQRDIEKLKDYCWWAVHKNRILEKRIEVNFKKLPVCEYRLVSVPQYGYETWRTLLKCPVVSIRKGPEFNSKADIFIMSVESTFSKRLMFYLFMRTPVLKRKRDEALMSQPLSESESVEYQLDRPGTSSTYDPNKLDFSRLTIGTSSKGQEIEETKPSSIGSSGTRTRSTSRLVSVKEDRPDIVHDSRPDEPAFGRAATNINRFHELARTETSKKKDSKRRHTLPLHYFQSHAQEDKKTKIVPLEIVNLLINRRHTSGRQRPHY